MSRVNWRRFFRRSQADAEQQQELESYIEVTTEEYIAQGMEEDEARRAARRKLGNLTRNGPSLPRWSRLRPLLSR